jgi:hypothetical protein
VCIEGTANVFTGDRANDIRHWKDELILEMKLMEKEIAALTVSQRLLDYSGFLKQ